MEKAEENLIRLHDILNELEERVGPLREQAEKAEKFIALDSEKKELEIGLWLETLGALRQDRARGGGKDCLRAEQLRGSRK